MEEMKLMSIIQTRPGLNLYKKVWLQHLENMAYMDFDITREALEERDQLLIPIFTISYFVNGEGKIYYTNTYAC